MKNEGMLEILTHVGGLLDVDLGVRKRDPLLALGVLFDLHRVVDEVGVIWGSDPPQDPASGLLGQGQVGGDSGGFSGRNV